MVLLVLRSNQFSVARASLDEEYFGWFRINFAASLCNTCNESIAILFPLSPQAKLAHSSIGRIIEVTYIFLTCGGRRCLRRFRIPSLWLTFACTTWMCLVSAVGEERWRESLLCKILEFFAYLLCVFVFLCSYLSPNMGDKPLTRKLFEEILDAKLDAKLSLLRTKMEDMTRTMNEFRKFIDEANRNYEDVNIHMSKMQEGYDILATENKVLKATVLKMENKITEIKDTYNEYEQYTRRECIEIQGIYHCRQRMSGKTPTRLLPRLEKLWVLTSLKMTYLSAIVFR